MLFAEPAPSGGCASGECAPEEAEPAPVEGFERVDLGAPAPASRDLTPAAALRQAPSALRPSSEPLPGISGDRWRQVVNAVRDASPRHGKSLAFGRVLSMTGGELTIGFTSDAGFHRTTVSGNGRALIEKVLEGLFGRPVKLSVKDTALPAEASAPSIAEEELRERAAHERSVDTQVRAHPAVQSALRILGGELEHIFVVERERPLAAGPDVPDAPDESA